MHHTQFLKQTNQLEYNETVECIFDKRKVFIHAVGERLHNHNHGNGHADNGEENVDRSSALVLSIALLIHNTFEGMSIGLAVSPSEMYTLLFAVLSHKAITAFSLGLSFMQAGWNDWTATLVMSIFAISGPFGTWIGYLILNDMSDGILQGVFMGMTSGTFLYISLSEVIPLEFGKVDHK